MKNLAFMLRRAGSLLPGLDTEGVGGPSWSDRVLEELDYTQEATNHQELAASFAGPPLHLGGRRSFGGPQRTAGRGSNRAGRGEADFRGALHAGPGKEARSRRLRSWCASTSASMLRLSRFSGDPHSGQHQGRAPDGRIAFLRFRARSRSWTPEWSGSSSIRWRARGRGPARRGASHLRRRADLRQARPGGAPTCSNGTSTASSAGCSRTRWTTMDAGKVASNAVLQFFTPAPDEADAIRGQRAADRVDAAGPRRLLHDSTTRAARAPTANWNRLLREWTREQAEANCARSTRRGPFFAGSRRGAERRVSGGRGTGGPCLSQIIDTTVSM